MRNNRAAFGGDPAAVTLVGQSAGAALVCSLMTAPAVRGRFRAAIALSGFGWARSAADRASRASALARHLGCDPARARAAELVRAGAALMRRGAPGDPSAVPFQPTVDGSVLPAPPVEAVRGGVVAEVPLWLGVCADELALFRPDTDPARRVPLNAVLWESGLVELAEAQLAAGGPVWASRFEHAPALPPFDVLGATHGADNACLWAHPPRFVERPLLGRPGGPMTAADLAVTEALHAAVRGMLSGDGPGWPAWGPGARPVFALRAAQDRVGAG